MTNIRPGQVIVGGLAAGVVMNACDWVINNYILNEMWQRALQARNVDVLGGPAELIKLVVIDFLLGVLIVWVYAGIRPRLGPGPGTAVIAAFTVFAAEALATASFAGTLFSWDMFIRSSFLGLASTLAAGYVGGWVYSEPDGQDS